MYMHTRPPPRISWTSKCGADVLEQAAVKGQKRCLFLFDAFLGETQIVQAILGKSAGIVCTNMVL